MNNKKLPVLLLLGVVVVIIILGVVWLKGSTPAANNQTQGPSGTNATQQTPAQEPIENVTVTKQGFSPATITIKVGSRVIWMNKSGGNVTVNSDPHPIHNLYPILNPGSFADGSSVQVVFDKPGTYTYHNHFNPSQKGTVVVQ